jgi:hypothetical protein
MSNPVLVNVIPPMQTEVTENAIEKAFAVFPNPATSTVTIVSKAEQIQKVMLYSMEGKLIKSIAASQSSVVNLDLSDLSGGMYYLDCLTEKAREKVKLIKY